MSTANEHRRNLESSGTGEMGEALNMLPSGASASAPAPTSQPTDRLLVELLATIGHEFRTPLTVIDRYTSTLLRRERQLSPGEQREFLQMIRQAGKRLKFLTERLIEIAQLEYSLVDIPTLTRQAIAVAERHVPEPLRDRFTFHLQCRDGDGNQAQDVHCYRVDTRLTREMYGLGLGLTVCHYLVALHQVGSGPKAVQMGQRVPYVASPGGTASDELRCCWRVFKTVLLQNF